MSTVRPWYRPTRSVRIAALLAIAYVPYAQGDPFDPGTTLNGDRVSTPIKTMATGGSDIVVGDDRSVSGTVETTGIIDATAAHVHEGAPGATGAIVVTLTQTLTNRWEVPPGATLTPRQFASYVAGNLYVDVHTTAHPAGELRRQLAR